MKGMILFLFSIVFLQTGIFTFGDRELNVNNRLEYSPYINGVLTKAHEIIKNQDVKLVINSDGVNEEFSSNTNDKGEFEFESILLERDNLSFDLLSEQHVSILMTTSYENEIVILWSGYFTGFKIEDYERNNLSNLSCDVSNPLKYFLFIDEKSHTAPVTIYSQCALFGYFKSEIYRG